jgi:hypothetical protein
MFAGSRRLRRIRRNDPCRGESALFSEAFRRLLLQSGGANISGADRAWQAAAFLTRSQTKNVSARSLVQDSGARDPGLLASLTGLSTPAYVP